MQIPRGLFAAGSFPHMVNGSIMITGPGGPNCRCRDGVGGQDAGVDRVPNRRDGAIGLLVVLRGL